jgi:quercetin dioxygenase-like cupin family protein
MFCKFHADVTIAVESNLSIGRSPIRAVLRSVATHGIGYGVLQTRDSPTAARVKDPRQALAKSLNSPDVTRDCGHGKLELVSLEDTTVARFTLQPGWKWSEHIRPMVNTESCQVEHRQYIVRGRLRIVHDDGNQVDVGPGDLACIPPGHDAWVLGDEPFVGIDFSPDMKHYAQDSDDSGQ